MRNILFIGHHDVRLFLSDRAAYVWLFVLPGMIMFMMGFMVRGATGPNVARPVVVVENRDQGFLGRVFRRALGEEDLTVVGSDQAEGADRRLVVPEDFTARVLAGEVARIRYTKLEGSDQNAAALLEARLFRAVTTVNAHLIEAALRGAGAPPDEATLIALQEEPDLVSVETRFAGFKPRPVGFALSLPGSLVFYVMLNLLIFGGASLSRQRVNGMLRRIVVSPVTRFELIFGKLYGLVLLAGVQVAFFLGIGCFLPGINIMDGFWSILLVLFLLAWVAASLGLLAGSVLKAEEKIVGICLVLGLTLGALGGCWWPLDIAWPPLRVAAHCVPTGWAMDALHHVITYGDGLTAAAGSLGVLALFGVAANLAAVRFFRV